jgi:signal transduction histidine kinase/ActR/RegA family two-component response regulator
MTPGRPEVLRSWSPYLILALSLLLTAAVTWYAAGTSRTQDRLRFDNLVQKNQAILQNRMETYVALLRGTNGLFASSDDVSREDFRAFVAGLEMQRRYPGIQGIGFSLRVRADWKAAVTDAVRRSGDSRFRIWPDSSRDDLFPVVYLEPLDRRNRAALGFDMLTEPVCRAAMERARDTGQPAATGRVTLVQEIEGRKQAGFLIYVPVYRRGQPIATVEERRAALGGFVYGSFRADDLLQSTLGSSNPNLAVEVYAGELSLHNLLHRSHSPAVVGPTPRFRTMQRFDMAGCPWTVAYSTLPAFEAGSVRDQVALLLLSGLLVSLTLFGVTRAQVRARAQAEIANRAKDRFMATLSHELRTPLTPVLAVLSRLESHCGPLPAAVRDGLAMIRRNVELEARLIDDLLDLTRISQGKLELRRGPTDLRQVLAHALEASARPDAPGPQVVTELAAEDLRVWADAPRLTQVFWNLISNARKFTPPGGIVRVRAWREDGELVAEVSDTGIGIAPEVLPRIFDAFQQGQRTITRKFGGLGLGLAISERIVELHGGRIAAASAGRGQGATFTVRLPAGAPAGPAEAPAAAAALSERPQPASSSARPLHILLVEDHPDTAEAMADLLRATGRQVTVAGSVSEGMAAAAAALHGRRKDDRIDLVLSDIGLPDGSGHELMSELARRYGLRGIALTGYGMDDDVGRSQEAGFSRHLTKPVSLEQLETAIRQVAGEARG